MQQFREILLNVWREVCRHTEIGESTASIAEILRQHMPVDCVVVSRIDLHQAAIETVAVAHTAPDASLPFGDKECSPAEMQTMLAWCGRGEVLQRRHDADRRELSLLVPVGVEEDVLAGPLAGEHGLRGALILVAPKAQTFREKHVAMVQALLEPFANAMENDRRLREMAALREAAEADKRSLLTRMGRKELGDTIVGSESGLRAVMERVELVGRSDVPVLIFGETGTGKELIARAIHCRSPHASGPFMRVNCGAIPAELIDSELFGHERGSFTGATDRRKGWFERADGGTLFLDEIGELPLPAQVRLLRVLQDGILQRVGGQTEMKVAVRIVAATHRDLAAMVQEKRFREDLWYRIAVFPISLPPLRERPEDIAALASHFAHRAAVRFGLPFVAPSPQDIRLLLTYPWPGNVRELATVIDRAAILGDGRCLEVAKALGIAGGFAPTVMPAPPAAPQPASPEGIVPLDAAMRRHIESALAATWGRVEGLRGAAVLLKINPHTLRARMRKLGIDWRAFRQQSPT